MQASNDNASHRRYPRNRRLTVLNTVYNRVKIVVFMQYKVDDSVRVSKFKTVFDKDYMPNWITEVFKIIAVTYLLEDS